MAFRLRQDDYQVQTRTALMMNSLTFKVGDVIVPNNVSSGVVTNATASTAGDVYVLGLVVGFSGPNGEVITTGADPLNTPAFITAGASNTTVQKYSVQYIPITPEMEFLATLDATAGTTANSDTPFVWFNLADCRTVSETTAIVYGSGSAPLQLLSYGLDSADTNNKTIICRFAKAGAYRP